MFIMLKVKRKKPRIMRAPIGLIVADRLYNYKSSDLEAELHDGERAIGNDRVEIGNLWMLFLDGF